MGALPKKRRSNSRQGNRRLHQRIKLPEISICPQCHQAHRTHHVCPHCGTYRGRQVLQGREQEAAE